MKTFPSDYIHLTMTSPPYDNLRTYNGNNEQWNENVWMSVIEELFRITKQGGVVVWVVGDATIKGSETGTSFKQALWAMDCGFKLHDTMIWHKGSFTGVGSLSVRYAPTWEFMFVFVKGAIGTFNPIKDRRNKVKGKIRGNLRKPDGTMKRMSTNGNDRTEYGQRFSVWEIPPCGGNKTGHPAPFPENLCRDHIISWSNEGDTVLDPFMGSGTTGRAAKVLNREFIGIEIDLEYYQIAGKRIAELEKA
tara:strand:+ start:425 stop:1168 length:744 start_codon:yes stop_codon:yes gene_type:complete